MKGSNTFQTVLVVIAIAMVLIAVLIFSGIIPIGKKTEAEVPKGTVTIWGVLSEDQLRPLINSFNLANKGITVIYQQVDATTLDQNLAEAIATGKGPDLLYMTQDMVLRQGAKAFKIPYEEFPERTFRDTYIQEGDLFLSSDGVVAIPLIVDPMILYYNRNLFEAAGFTSAPKTWEEVVSMTQALTKRVGPTNSITQSAITLGAYTNIKYAKDILAMLFIQAGNPIIGQAAGGSYVPALGRSNASGTGSPAQDVLTFFTQFADPSRDTYTWNKSLPPSDDAFVNEQVAMYFGYASELPKISSRNPNLNFDVAIMPQIKDSKSNITFGRVTAVAVMKTSKNFQAAKKVQELMSQKEFVTALVSIINEAYPVAPARRDLLQVPPKNLLGPALYKSALISRGWLDPGESRTNPIFKAMVDDVIRGAVTVGQAIADANAKLGLIIN